MLKVLLLCAALVGQDPVRETPSPDAPTPAPAGESDRRAAATDRDEEVVCRREPVTGSNRTRRVCVRQGVADYNREQTQRWRDRVIDRRGTLPCETDGGC